MDCSHCSIVKVDNIVDNVDSSAYYGNREDTKKLKDYRNVNMVVFTEAQNDAAFGHYAAGIIADYYIEGILKNNLGHPSPILDYSIACSIEESKALGSGYNVSSLYVFISTVTTEILLTHVKLTYSYHIPSIYF